MRTETERRKRAAATLAAAFPKTRQDKTNGRPQVGYQAPPKHVMVTPEMAARWLEGNIHNRDIRIADVNRYAEDMRRGRWKLTHQAIAFTEDGTLIDGQHRLWAILESGVTVPMLVVHGLAMDTQLVIDTHRGRTASDALNLMDKHGKVTPIETSTLQWMLWSPLNGKRTRPKMSHTQIDTWFQRYGEAVRFAISSFPYRRKRLTASHLAAIVARASFTVDRTKLQRFGFVLSTGEAETPGEKSVFLFRDAIQGSSPAPSVASAYMKFQAALKAFLQNRQLKVIRTVQEELWHYPGEKEVVQDIIGMAKRAQAIRRRFKRSGTTRHLGASEMNADSALRKLGSATTKEIIALAKCERDTIRTASKVLVELGIWKEEGKRKFGKLHYRAFAHTGAPLPPELLPKR